MTLAELRSYIHCTREQEGVNWYLQNTSETFGLSFDLYLYSEDIAVVDLFYRVTDIREESGRLPIEKLAEIAAARDIAVMNPLWRTRRTNKGKPTRDEIFASSRNRWLEYGRYTFVAEHM